MGIIKKIENLREKLQSHRQSCKKIGFVPTMGYLHQGHMNLVNKAVIDNEIVVLSIFVNPTQFGPDEDYEDYPRDLKRDAAKAKKAGVDYIFTPEVEEMYPQGYNTLVQVNELTERLCGASRPSHFQGVTTVVSKLFNIVEPDTAYFGQKDYQQFVVIKRMVQDLNFSINLNMVPIVREDDGLAVSSRNKYLNSEQREAATILYDALSSGKEMILEGERDAVKVKNTMEAMIEDEQLAIKDYVAVVDSKTLKPVSKISGDVVMAMAVFIGETRLIDNFYIREDEL